MPVKEGRYHRYRRYRSHGEHGLCVIFKYAAGEQRPSEMTGHYEDHYKLPVHMLPRTVFNLLGEGKVTPTQSWKALEAFETQYQEVRRTLEESLAPTEKGRELRKTLSHSTKKINWLLREGLESARQEFYAQATEYGLGKVEKGKLVLFSYEKIQESAIAAHDAKLAKIAARLEIP